MRSGSMLLRACSMASLALLAFAIASTASALPSPVTWYLSDVAFSDGSTLTGSFMEQGGNVTSYDILFAGVNYTPSNSYINCDGGTGATDTVCFNGLSGIATDGTPWSQLQIQADGPMDTALTGTFSVLTAGSVALTQGCEFECGDPTPPNEYFAVSGSVTTTDPSAVPEPASLFLLGAGLVGFSVARRRREIR
jgi:PEP-CTERM motif